MHGEGWQIVHDIDVTKLALFSGSTLPTHGSLGMRVLQSLPAVAMPTSCKLLKACKTYTHNLGAITLRMNGPILNKVHVYFNNSVLSVDDCATRIAMLHHEYAVEYIPMHAQLSCASKYHHYTCAVHGVRVRKKSYCIEPIIK